MNARSAKPPSVRRYRRRILGWGAVGVAGVFAVGGPIFVNRAEDDLELRAVVELEAAGVGNVTPKFSGQDGELRCREGAVDIPDDVVESIRSLWGVSSLDVAESCTTGDGAAPSVESATTAEAAENGDDTTSSTNTETTTTVPDLDSVAAVVANDSQFSTLTGLLSDAGLTETLAGEGPFTVFAPTDAAFEALGADITGALGRDPDLLAAALTHHVTARSITSTDLAEGMVEMLDGASVAVDLSDGVMLISGESAAAVTETDLLASNGVVHAIDQVLIPEGLVIGTDPAAVLAGADFVDGQIVLRGMVASDAQRDALVGAAEAQVDPANVVDELVVDTDADDAAINVLVEVIAAIPPNLVSGTAELTGEGIGVSGVTADASSGETFDAAVANITGVTVTTALTERAVANADSAAALEADLNALVAANPILFDPSSTSISPESAATLDRVAALANRVGGIDIEIQGYTDTDGLAASNQALSEGRARSVSAALAERGIADDTLSTVGFGGTEPILDAAGIEDKAASRRVEFVVTATQ
jgi:outer membrane protein OmpA-like peptidoglycan-associated protein/uncharacterized surface protein with fasciclin (FAS1) repeats